MGPYVWFYCSGKDNRKAAIVSQKPPIMYILPQMKGHSQEYPHLV